MKHRNADNGIISTFVKLSFLSLSVMRQIWKARRQFKVVYDFRLAKRDWVSVMSRSLLGVREHQITHANVDIELNSFNTRESKA